MRRTTFLPAILITRLDFFAVNWGLAQCTHALLRCMLVKVKQKMAFENGVLRPRKLGAYSRKT